MQIKERWYWSPCGHSGIYLIETPVLPHKPLDFSRGRKERTGRISKGIFTVIAHIPSFPHVTAQGWLYALAY
jgi:hypothetical protein